MLEFNIVSNSQNKAIYGLKIIRNKATNPSITTLIDTGASFPVWIDGEDSFIAQFPDSRPANAETIIRGFGNGIEVVPIFIIPLFELSDGKNKIAYKNLPIAVMKRDYSFSMIISFTMLNKLNYNYISYRGRNGIKEISPVFQINATKDLYYVGYKSFALEDRVSKQYFGYFKTHTIIESIYIFSQ